MKKLAFLTVVLLVISVSLIYFNEFKSEGKVQGVFLTDDSLTLTKFEVPSIIYLAKGDTKEVDVEVLEETGKEVKINLSSSDEGIFKVIGDSIKGKGDGVGVLTITLNNGDKKEVKVVVTSLITEAKIDNDKPFIKCGEYTLEEAKLLDEILKYKINISGYQTRSGALAAARFLLLEFKNNLKYFNENGRLENHSDILHIDGEGRFYHEGLYISESKYDEITESSEDGPKMWGCLLKNKYYNKEMPNGLNCSGFITWTLYNGGFDIKDVGSGDYSYVSNELLDLRPKEKITKGLLSSDKVKAGDLIGFDGHIAMIIGIDNNVLYIGESYETGTRVRKFTHKELIKSDFTDIILMDDYYKEDGNYTQMW